MAIALMHLDVGTLSVVTVFVTALLGALLVFAGVQNRNIRAPMWWGGAQIVSAIGLGLAASSGALAPFVSTDIANALVLLGYGLTWAGARVFDGRPVLRPVIVFAPVVWLFARHIPAFESDANLRVVVVSTMTAMLAAATAEEFWRGRDEPLLSRWPTVIVLLAYAAVLLARIPATFFSPTLDDGSLLSGLSFALIAFGTLLFTVLMAFLLLNMTKERTELQHKINAMVDPLSGVANRRAFLDGARRLLAQQAIDGEPLAMMLFDLDRFKDINDRMGHAVGDRVLQTFAASSTLTLGADILFGRIGGEEFAALFPVGDLGEAYAVADRVRRNFAAAAQRFVNGDLEPTVSVGVTVAVNPPAEAARNTNDGSKDAMTSMDLLLEVADRALYRAKANGRNRVEATAPLDEIVTPFAAAPSIVPLIKAERVPFVRARGWRRRASYR
jgi:diguanylate cyclase (GGDEF)-like protein